MQPFGEGLASQIMKTNLTEIILFSSNVFFGRVIPFYIWEVHVKGYKVILLIHPTHRKAYFLFGLTKGLHSPTLGLFISRYHGIWETNLPPMRPMFQHL
jgi:hypothetical protein